MKPPLLFKVILIFLFTVRRRRRSLIVRPLSWRLLSWRPLSWRLLSWRLRLSLSLSLPLQLTLRARLGLGVSFTVSWIPLLPRVQVRLGLLFQTRYESTQNFPNTSFESLLRCQTLCAWPALKKWDVAPRAAPAHVRQHSASPVGEETQPHQQHAANWR